MVMGLRPGSKGSSVQLVLLLEVTDGGGHAQGAETKYTLGIKMGDSFVDSVLRAENHLFYRTVSDLVNTSGNAAAAGILFLFNVAPVQGQGCFKTL